MNTDGAGGKAGLKSRKTKDGKMTFEPEINLVDLE
jgi:hypothetical protein